MERLISLLRDSDYLGIRPDRIERRRNMELRQIELQSGQSVCTYVKELNVYIYAVE